MLLSLQVRDFAIVDQVDVEFAPGMTVLTGETGAGKSILVDALGLVLGERGNARQVRQGAARAEFSADFDIGALPHVADWLREQALDADDGCLLRRVVSAEGRSRAFINGNTVTVQQLKALGEMLLDIHGQHFHQSLGRPAVQRELLDHFGKLADLGEQVGAAYAEWQALQDSLNALHEAEADRDSRLDLLAWQLQELESLDPQPGEAGRLQQERQRLAHSGRIADSVNAALQQLSDAESGNVQSLLAEARRGIESVIEYDGSLADVAELIAAAGIQVDEATDALNRYAGDIDADPGRHDQIEERLAAFRSLARKHRADIDDLASVRERLRDEHDQLVNASTRGRELEKAVEFAASTYRRLADGLSAERRKAAGRLSTAVSAAMDGLGMPGGQFEAAVESTDPEAYAWGTDRIEFRLSANPGQPRQPLARVASGGELSRMSLAIQVIVSDGSTIPTMVFDEVDSGVGGGVAEMVGRRLAELSGTRQVLCVTHLPQVASFADRHLRINKVSDGNATRTTVRPLDDDERVNELARMLGGVDITRKTLEHAAEMLADAPKKRA